MNRTIATIAMLMIALPLVPPSTADHGEYEYSGAGYGSGDACREVAGSELCHDHQARADVTTSLVACEPESGSGLNTRFACTVLYSLTLLVTGGTPGCGYAYTEPTGYDLGCPVAPFIPHQTSPPKEGMWTHTNLPFGNTTVEMDGIVCADHLIVGLENCVPFTIRTEVVIAPTSAPHLPDLEEILRKAGGAVKVNLP